MPRLKDAYADEVPVGKLMYPSALVRRTRANGHYYLEDINGFTHDNNIFPALVLSKDTGNKCVKILTPSGVHTLSKFCVISYLK